MLQLVGEVRVDEMMNGRIKEFTFHGIVLSSVKHCYTSFVGTEVL